MQKRKDIRIKDERKQIRYVRRKGYKKEMMQRRNGIRKKEYKSGRMQRRKEKGYKEERE